MANRRGIPAPVKRSDDRWVVRLNLGYRPNGSYRRKDIYGKTAQEAEQNAIKALATLQQGLSLPDERQSVAQFLERWLEDTARHRLRPSSYDGYKRLVDLHIVPAIGRKRLAKLRPQDLTALYSALLDKGLAPRTVQYAHAVLHRALKDALRWDLVPRNVADAVDAPRPRRKEFTPLNAAQAKKLLEVAQGERLYALYVLALNTGMRLGELLGLKWQDVDWQARKLHIRRQLGRTGQGWTYSEVKTAKGRRTISVPPNVLATLKQHHKAQAEERLRAGSAWEEDDLVFCNHLGKPLERQNVQRRSFKPLLQQAELPDIRFHDLRHSAATLLLSLGLHPKVVQERLGHATIVVTMDVYSHVMPDLQEEAADKLEALLAAP